MRKTKRKETSRIGLTVLISSLLIFTLSVEPVAAEPPAPLSAWTPAPPSLDGVITLDDWSHASIVDFAITYAIGEPSKTGTLYVMNDANSLYLAVRIHDADLTMGDVLDFHFDNNGNGIRENGDDVLQYDFNAGLYGPAFFDSFWRNDFGLHGQLEDRADGGTIDITGAASADGSYNSIELSHPLSSGDVDHDFQLRPGDAVGFLVGYDDNGRIGYHWPSNIGGQYLDFSQEARIIVANPPIVSAYFTDEKGNLLPTDSSGNPKVDVILPNGKVRSTDPGRVIAWASLTNVGETSILSAEVGETLPLNWTIQPDKLSAKGAIRVLFQFADRKTIDITDQTSIALSTEPPEIPKTVSLLIANISGTNAGKNLDPDESILLSVKMSYALTGTIQPASSYPRRYGIVVSAAGWTGYSFTGFLTSGAISTFFTAYASSVGRLDQAVIIGQALVGAGISAAILAPTLTLRREWNR